jgi:hypothetical protein
MWHAKVSFLADMAPSTPRKLPEMTKIPLLSSSSSQFFFHGGLPPSMVAGHSMTATRPRHPSAPGATAATVDWPSSRGSRRLAHGTRRPQEPWRPAVVSTPEERRNKIGGRRGRAPLAVRRCRSSAGSNSLGGAWRRGGAAGRAPPAQGGHRSLGPSSLGGAAVPEAGGIELPWSRGEAQGRSGLTASMAWATLSRMLTGSDS